jgi:hypothetical protein
LLFSEAQASSIRAEPRAEQLDAVGAPTGIAPARDGACVVNAGEDALQLDVKVARRHLERQVQSWLS